MKGLFKLSLVEFKLFTREFFAAFFTLAFPVMLLVLFGMIYGNEKSDFFGGYGMVDIAVPSYTAMIIASSGLIKHIDLELAEKAIHQHFEVEFPHSRNDRLPGLFVGSDQKSGVLLRETVKRR